MDALEILRATASSPLMHDKHPIQIAANADHSSGNGTRIQTALNRVMGLLGKFAAVCATSG